MIMLSGMQIRWDPSHLDKPGWGPGGRRVGRGPGLSRHQGAEGALGLREADGGRSVGNGLEAGLSLLEILRRVLGVPGPGLGGASAPQPVVEPHHDHHHHQVETGHNLECRWMNCLVFYANVKEY